MAEFEANPEVSEKGDVEQLSADEQLQAVEGTADDVSTTSQKARQSQRVRTLTEKGKELYGEHIKKAAHRFSVRYEKWKVVIKDAKGAIDGLCSKDLLQEHVTKVLSASKDVNAAYDDFRRIESPDSDTRRRMDTCEAITKTIIESVRKCPSPSSAVVQRDEELWKDSESSSKSVASDVESQRDEKWKETESMPKLEASDRLSVKSHHTKLSSHSRVSSRHSSRLSAKRQDTAAEVAANEAALQVLLAQEIHMKEIERQEAEIAQRQKALEAKRREVERLETVKKLNAAKARQRVYEQSECSDEEIYNLLHHRSDKKNEVKSENNDQHMKRCSSPQNVTPQREVSTEDLVKAFAVSLNASRLPVPEPTIFSGDPIRYNDWKISFQTLIDRKNIPVEEKTYYLRKYVSGPARKAIEGYFPLGTESAYYAAWTVLKERYGNPFLVAKAFRDKLDAWPKISSKGSMELQAFADFLCCCKTAMSQMKGLEVLNDCNENQKMLAKLPDWLTSRWNRKVTEVQEETHTFPSFSQFVDFISREAKIACNPITSLYALKPSETEGAKTTRNRGNGAKVLATRSNERTVSASCVYCERSGHSLLKCRRFINESIVERLKFVQDKKLCFGCLNSGHRSKDCESRETCDTCNKRHPTCLHDNRNKEDRTRRHQTKNSDRTRQTNSDVSQDNSVTPTTSEATSNRVTQNVDDTHTSSIIPVWVSTKGEPEHEILVYALLDTQSDTTFILEETAQALHVKGESTQLKLTTMSSRNTVVACRKLSGLQVRGFYSNKTISLPVTYSRDFIPANRDHIPSPATAKAWPHLECIASEIAPLQSCDVGLLIGYNCPQALVPREVVSGRENQPFAQKTDLGWSIVGYGNPCLDYGDAFGISHQVIVKEVVPDIQPSSNFTNKVHYVYRTQIKEIISPTEVIPTGEIKVGELSTSDPEVKKVQVHKIQVEEQRSLLDRLHKFSDWSRMVKAVARLKRYVKEAKDHKSRSHDISSLQERKEAELTIIKMVQETAFAQQIKPLQHHDVMQMKDKVNELHKLCPFLDDQGILRVGGRLTHAALHPNVKHPAILPRDSHVSALLVKHYHEKTYHQGRGITMNELRANGFWILGCSKIVSSYIYKCVKCRRFRRRTEQQKMADLPEDRMETTPPFTYCGMDCFGPFHVKEGRKELKRYGLLITCMCSRAVHLEMLDDLSTDSLINSLRAFMAIRGTVRQIRCDQGTNFVGTRNEFIGAFKEMDQAKLGKLDCEFLMNTPASSHMGGVWERQIRTIRSVLMSILEQSAKQLDSSSLRTFLYEVMAVINSRPLTTDQLCDPSNPEPLTPNHILTMKSTIISPPPGRFVKEDLYLRKRWRRVQLLANTFWTRWKKEYLLNLQGRQKWTKEHRNAKINDVVLLKDKITPRNQWKLARIIEVYPGKDGKVRKVKLLLSDPTLDRAGKRTSKPVHLERPIQKTVILMEAEEDSQPHSA
ncbi:unnamed protein product [Oreochromis niloticus]|nr:unnamed protein product [Mustela putorius furo]